MEYKSSFLNEAIARGFFYQATNLEAMDEFLTTKGRSGYVGFDITAKSLHVGHFIPIFLMRLFQKHGHKPIILVGGGTTKIGDPSFKNAARPILSDEEISENMKGIKACLLPFLKFGAGPSDAVMVNNADWLDELKYVPFLREVGKHFSVNRMIGFESVKAKLTENNTLSFSEFNYMIMQAYDFCELFTKMNCGIQFGGQDQWGNIVCGVEFIRKKLGKEAFGFTNPLLTTSDGQKMGKTAQGAVWLLKDMYHAYDFWQYWRNVSDEDVIKLMYLFSNMDVQEIKKLENINGQELNDVKKMLADEVTSTVHGKESLVTIHQSVAAIFNADFSEINDLSSVTSIPKYDLNRSDLELKSVIDIMVESAICDSRGDAKRLLRSGGIYINDKTISEDYRLSSDAAKNDILKLSCGKKKHLLICLK